MNFSIDELRPYTDSEIPSAMLRMANDPLFVPAASFVFPKLSVEQARNQLLKVKTINDFQLQWMYCFNQKVIQKTISSFTYSFSRKLDPKQGYLFVSNHRDIVLDSSLLQNVLVESGLPTSQITYGDNLAINQFVTDVARSNKMFKVVRNSGRRELLEFSKILSAHLHTIILQGVSCWIAQSSGRAKKGDDTTNPGLLKMFSLCSPTNNPVESYRRLHIVPVSVSYEMEPCDFLKARELSSLEKNGKYEKAPGEDLHSILTGIEQWKGNVHIHVAEPITEAELNRFEGLEINAFVKALAELLDDCIRSNYHLFPTNYIACDLLTGKSHYNEYYSEQQKLFFVKHVQELDDHIPEQDRELARNILLHIYANPLLNS